MKVYTDRKTAPLKFHKFLIWFSLPLGVLISLSAAIVWFSRGDASRYLFDTIYYLLHVLLSILCLVGMWRWKPYGPKALIARQILEIVNQLSLTLSNFGFGRPVEDSLARMLGVIIATSIFLVYYKKRMPLFRSSETILLERAPADPALQETFSDAPAKLSCIQSDDSAASAFPSPEAPSEVVTIKASESPAPKQSRLPHLWGVHSSRILVGLLTAALVVSGAFNAYQYSVGASLHAQVDDLEAQLDQKTSDYAYVQSQIDSMKSVLYYEAGSIEYIAHQASMALIRARIVSSDEVYHRINCPLLSESELVLAPVIDESFANSSGFSPCFFCNSSDSLAFQQYCENSNSVFDFIDLIRNGSDTDWYIQGVLAKEKIRNHN